jgi:tetratricopeptide (TPR) repeat protein
LSVRPFSISQQFTSQNSDPHQAGQQLQVSDVVTGHYLRRSDRLTVTLEAMDIVKDEMVWRASIEVGVNEMLRLRDELTSALQKGLLPSLGVSGGELSVTKPKSPEAYELYLRSQDSAYWNFAHNKDGIALLERSLAIDPGYAPAWLALGVHYYHDADMATGDQETFSKCIAAFERAHQLDPNLLIASTWLIGTRRVYGDLAVSFMQVQELARKRPRRAEVHLLFAELLRSAGALEQGARECEITHQLDPDLWTDCFVLYIHMGDLVRARHEIDRSSGEFSSFILGHILLREGRVEEALPRLKMIPMGISNYELVGDCLSDPSTPKCLATAERTEKGFLTVPDPDAWYFGAALFAFVGRGDAAIRLLDADIRHSFCFYPAVDHDPLFDKIRGSAEFKTKREAGIECKKRFAPYTKIQIQ